MIADLASHILALPAWLALVVVFVLPALESSVFVGFVFPGEIALVLGGVLASQGRVPLAAVLVAGICGAIVGDSVGYLVGRRYGRRVLEGTLGRFVRHEHFDRSERYLAERGGKAVFFGRFTASLRALIPGLAGMSGMRYRKFAAYNVAGGAAWATVTVMMGYLGGSSWQHVAHLASRIGLAALALFVLAFAGGYLLRRHRRVGAEGGPDTLWVGSGRRLVSTRAGRWAGDRFPVQVAFVGRRLDPRTPAGLATSCFVGLAVVCAWTFGGLTEDVVAGDGLASLDASVHGWVVGHRTAWLDPLMKAVTWSGSNLVLVPVIAVVAVVLWRRRGTWRPAALVVAVYGAAVLGHAVVAATVRRARPPATDWLAAAGGWSYPSGHTTQVTAFWGALVLALWPSASSRARVALSAAAAVAVLLVGASRVYLGVHWLTDVLGGLTLSATLVCVAGATVLGRTRGQGRGDEAGDDDDDADDAADGRAVDAPRPAPLGDRAVGTGRPS